MIFYCCNILEMHYFVKELIVRFLMIPDVMKFGTPNMFLPDCKVSGQGLTIEYCVVGA